MLSERVQLYSFATLLSRRRVQLKVFACAQPFSKCNQAYATRANSPNPNVEIVTVGVQNKITRSTLLLNRLAVKNKAKKEMARIQNKGEKIAPTNTANPVAFSWLLIAVTNSGPSKAIKIAANPQSTILR